MTKARTTGLAVVLGSLSAFAPLSIDMYLPAFPAMARELTATPSDIQLTLTACTIGLAVGQLIPGPLSDRLGRRGPLLVGLAIYLVASAACIFAPSAITLTVLRLVQGMGGAAGIVISRAVARDLFEGGELARFFSLLMLVNSLGPVVAPALGAVILHWTTWRGVFVVLAAIGLLLLVTCTLSLKESLPVSRRRPGSLSIVGLLADRVFLGYSLSCALAFAALFSYISGSSFELQTTYGLSATLFSVVFGVNSLAIMGASQVNSWLLGRFSPRRLLAVGLAGTVFGAVALLVSVLAGVGLPGVLPALFVLAGAVGMVFPNATALAMSDHPDKAGNASALLGTFQFLVGGVAAPLASTAVSMGVVMTAVAVAALSAFLLLTRARATVAAAVT
ncbi:multidrug effflux MFS transporter [Kutzneria buriramensis]|uniref:DHA1 family bicyclomycin/chloramphenicol resistance-like MFS transporter n=1 Tax=Kutzneria buriramensis TaxID=1045776 RepID=A0A3E0HA45_9PSEU|nr:multidrug effflux MFS transporter [Kutzneria buriramensis]REH40936.1 DHA1 family bicyclomycin/chloramphenicol resistance-like MFS transporter [Kutzneria buriramensis]